MATETGFFQALTLSWSSETGVTVLVMPSSSDAVCKHDVFTLKCLWVFLLGCVYFWEVFYFCLFVCFLFC